MGIKGSDKSLASCCGERLGDVAPCVLAGRADERRDAPPVVADRVPVCDATAAGSDVAGGCRGSRPTLAPTCRVAVAGVALGDAMLRVVARPVVAMRGAVRDATAAGSADRGGVAAGRPGGRPAFAPT